MARFAFERLLVLLVGTLLVQPLSAQSGKAAKADRLFSELAFQAAIPLYRELAEESDDPIYALRLGDAYRLTQDYNGAEQWYSKVVAIDTLDPVYWLHYGQALMANEKYAQAKPWFDRYAQARPGDRRGKSLSQACRNIDDLVASSFPAEVSTLTINTAQAEFGPAFYGQDRLMFASERDTILGVQRQNRWYGAPFLNLYTSPVLAEGQVGKPSKLKGDINGRYHDGPGVLEDENTMYFTRNPAKTPSRHAADLGPLRLQLAKAVKIGRGDKWVLTDETAMPFNNPAWSVGHPALSADGTRMIFTSDMPGGYGGTDLYQVSLLADGSAWSDPQNLGAQINTPGNELFPFWHPDGTLFYASDGLPGFGGLDVHAAAKSGNGFGMPENLGKPINSSRDDFGLIFDPAMNNGYMVSNRFGGAGSDDLYAVKNVGIQLEGVVTDAYSGKPIPNAGVRLRQAGNLRYQSKADADGSFAFQVGSNRQYELVVHAAGYKHRVVPANFEQVTYPASVRVDVALEDTLQINLLVQVIDQDSRNPLPGAVVMVYNKCTNSNEEMPVDETGLLRIRLDPNCTFYLAGRKRGYIDDNEVVSTVGMAESSELGAILELPEIREDLVIELKNIYYDYGRYYIREDAVDDLDNLAALMEEYPSLKIEISSHTDSRGSDEFNKRLSQRRAETCVDYLVTKGTDRDRLVARGYGEYVLKNDCPNGVTCTEEEHQVNRRTEFKVLSFDKVLYSDDVASPAVNLYKKAFGEDKVERTQADMIALGLIDPPATIIVQRDEGDETPSGPISSPLLNRQREASQAAARDVGLDDDDGRTAGAERTSTVLEGSTALAPDPVPPSNEPIQQEPNAITLEPDPVPRTSADPVSETGSASEAALAPEPIERTPTPVPIPLPVERTVPSPAPKPVERPTPKPPVVPAATQIPNEIPAQDPNAWWQDGVSYAVQIAFGSTNVSGFADFEDLGKVYTERKSNGTPVIMIGHYRKFSEANSIQQTVRARGVRDAFVVSYVDGERLE